MAYISKINQEKNEWSKIDSDLIAVGIFEEKTLTDLVIIKSIWKMIRS